MYSRDTLLYRFLIHSELVVCLLVWALHNTLNKVWMYTLNKKNEYIFVYLYVEVYLNNQGIIFIVYFIQYNFLAEY